MGYELKLSSRANRAMGEFLGYYNNRVNGVGNPVIARKFLRELEKTFEEIAVAAESYGFCEDERLKKRGIRKAHLKHYKYKILYHINGNEVIVDLICHDTQDFEERL